MSTPAHMTHNGIRRLSFTVTGKLHGWAEDNETDEQAKARIALAAEQRVNEQSDVRLHIQIEDKSDANNL